MWWIELVQVVDEMDNIIWYKSRKDLTDNDVWRIIVVNIYDETWEYILVQERSKLKKLDAWLWSLAVAWTLDKDDTYESCAIREIEEEIWVVCKDIKELSKVFYKSSLWYRQCVIYNAYISIDTNIIIQEEEVEQVKWVWWKELKRWVNSNPEDFTKYTIEILKDLEFFRY